MQKLWLDICQLPEFYVLQQDSATVHRACKAVDQLSRETLDFILPHYGHQTVQN